MTCDEIDGLLAAYSLAALSSAEMAAVEEHLDGCRRHDTALAELQGMATRLPLAAVEREPSAELRSRLLSAFDAELAARQRAAPAAVRPRWRLSFARPAFAYAVAAALLLAAIGLATWNVVLQLGEGDTPARMVSELIGDVGNARVIYLSDDNVAVLDLDLEEPPAERVYQAWGIYGEEPVSLGLVPNRGVTAFHVDLADPDAVAISVEPEGGSPQPTSDPVLIGFLN